MPECVQINVCIYASQGCGLQTIKVFVCAQGTSLQMTETIMSGLSFTFI